MKRLTLAQRISAVACLVLVTVTIALIYFVQEGFSKDIAFTELELSGDAYQRPLEDLLRSVPEHELVARRQGLADREGLLKDLEAKVEAAMKDLRTVDAKLGKSLQFTPEGLAQRKRSDAHWEVLQTQWEAIKAASGSPVADSDKLHEAMTANIRTMIAHAGDESNLILDSDLDSYYLMDGTLVTLPQTQDRLSQIEKMGQDVLGKGPLTTDQRTALAVQAALMAEGDRDRMVGDAQTALNEDPNFHGVSATLQKNVPPAMHDYTDASQKLLDMMQKLAAGGGDATTAEQFGPAVEAARDASFDLSGIGMAELDVLLQKRIDDLSTKRMEALGWLAFGLMISIGIAAKVIVSVSGTLRGMSQKLLDRSYELASTSEQMETSSQKMADGALRQAATIEQTSASTVQISAMASNNSQNSRSAAMLVAETQGRIVAANELLGEMVGAISSISESSTKISKIIKVIDAIAFQTNLLALNATVEAARAGAAGAGFAVVAEEVRSLSQRCAQAARDTSELIQETQGRTVEGREKVEQVVSAIVLVTENADRLKALVEDVSMSSEQQTMGIEQMASALGEMDKITQGNAATAQESAEAVKALKTQADVLLDIVEEVSVLAGAA